MHASLLSILWYLVNFSFGALACFFRVPPHLQSVLMSLRPLQITNLHSRFRGLVTYVRLIIYQVTYLFDFFLAFISCLWGTAGHVLAERGKGGPSNLHLNSGSTSNSKIESAL